MMRACDDHDSVSLALRVVGAMLQRLGQEAVDILNAVDCCEALEKICDWNIQGTSLSLSLSVSLSILLTHSLLDPLPSFLPRGRP
jgi:hypothetical protein